MLERPQRGEKALLVNVGIGRPVPVPHRAEFEELARSAGAVPVASINAQRSAPSPRFLVGSGKAQEIGEQVRALGVDVILVNYDLMPSQERNLERLCGCRVLDRSGLILDIFAQRARSHEGKLQVELAQLEHLSTRLVRGWTHLERQKGGIGLRGPGETQLETDRRLLGQRVKSLRKRLEKVRQQRRQGRRNRQRSETPVISLVGYTNAGKSTLFNRLTAASVYAEDQLFATLDPTLRRLRLPQGPDAVIADTVGFVRDLPHELVAAFHSTLEETREADLLLHVVDGGDPERTAHMGEVNQVLDQIGAARLPQIEVFNKIDVSGEPPRVERDGEGQVRRVWLSAATGAGVEALLAAIAAAVHERRATYRLHVGPGEGRLRASLFQLGAVLSEETAADGSSTLIVSLVPSQLVRLQRETGIESRRLLPLACDSEYGYLQSTPKVMAG